MAQFVNRTRELSYLDSRYQRNRAEIAVIYGRRRVGKSSLVYEWAKDKRHIFFFAQRTDGNLQLRQFSQEIRKFQHQLSPMDEPTGEDFQYPDWESAFRALNDLAKAERLVVIIDEYPYLVEQVPGISTILQKVWDTALQDSGIYLILTGSLLSVMRRDVLDSNAPLYKRHTWPFELQPLWVDDLPSFFPQRNAAQIIDTYAIFGGMPYYLTAINSTASLQQNIEEDVLSPAGSLFDEPRLQLHEELRGNIENYIQVLSAIARGNHQRADVANQSGLNDVDKVGSHLGTLIELGLVEHRQPVGMIRKPNRWGTYHLRDPFFRFWHRWVAPRRNYLQINQGLEPLSDQIRQQMYQIVAPVWEEIARAHLFTASARGDIGIQIEEIGSWWSRKAQIDVVAVNRAERRVVFGEAKWQRAGINQADLDRLINRGLLWLDGDMYWDVTYAFFVRDKAEISAAIVENPQIRVYGPEDIVTKSQ